MCVFVCVCEREGEREREPFNSLLSSANINPRCPPDVSACEHVRAEERMCVFVCVYVCVCVRVSEKEGERERALQLADVKRLHQPTAPSWCVFVCM